MQPSDNKYKSPWLSIVGIGDDGLDGLSPAARALVDQAEILAGGSRHLALIPEDGRPRHPWPSPLTELVERLLAFRGRRVCVLATGDPLWYGVGTLLARSVPAAERVILPAPGSIQLACARLGWSVAEIETVTLHGRPLALLHPAIQPGARLVVLSEDAATPAKVAGLLRERGFGPSRLIILEHMGGPKERRLDSTADAFALADLADFNTLAILCAPGPEARLLPRTPGLPDTAFRCDGQLTKREVRAATLAALMPMPGGLLWDIGAGCGSVAIEWMRCDPRNRAIAIEPRADRRAFIADNATALGTPGLTLVDGRAPGALAGLPVPDAIFLGGGITEPGLVDQCWDVLPRHGRLVANVVTLEGEQAVLAARSRLGGDLARLAVSRAEPVGPFEGWRPLMSVTQWSAIKP